MTPELELLVRVAKVLNPAGLRYFVTGSVAAMRYGEPRMTQDIDIAAFVRYADVSAFVQAFKDPDYYLERSTMLEAMEHESQFNIIDNVTGLKVDVMCVEMTPYNESRFQRASKMELVPGVAVPFSSPEDVILMKLVYVNKGGGERHFRDIAGMFKVTGPSIDTAYIESWAPRLGVTEQWAAVKSTVNAK